LPLIAISISASHWQVPFLLTATLTRLHRALAGAAATSGTGTGTGSSGTGTGTGTGSGAFVPGALQGTSNASALAQYNLTRRILGDLAASAAAASPDVFAAADAADPIEVDGTGVRVRAGTSMTGAVTSTPGAVTSALSAVPSMVGTAVAFDGFRRGVADTLGLRLRRVVNRTVPGLQLVDVGAILHTPHDAPHGAAANAHHGASPLSSTRLMRLCAACECSSRRPGAPFPCASAHHGALAPAHRPVWRPI